MKYFLSFFVVLSLCLTSTITATAQGRGDFNKPRGYMGMVEFGAGGSVNKFKGAPVSLTVVNGYRFMPGFAIGGGVGVTNILDKQIIPLFLHLRSDLMDECRFSPYIALNVGGNISIGGNFHEGFMAEPSVGIGTNVGTKSRLYAGIYCSISSFHDNVNHMELKTTDRGGYPCDPYIKSYVSYDALTNCVLGLKVGMSF